MVSSFSPIEVELKIRFIFLFESAYAQFTHVFL